MERILMMGLTPPLEGGSERHIAEISSRIPNVAVFTQKGSLCKNKIEAPVINYNPFLRNISFFLSSLVFAISLTITPIKKYTCIHIHENLLYLLAPLFRLRYNVVITVHGISGFKFYDKKYLWFLFKNSLGCANKIISVSLADQEILGKEIRRVVYIPNGVDLSTYKSIKNKKIEKKIVFVGRIHEQKGVETLLKSFKKISKEFPMYRLEVIGKKEGQYYEKLSKKYEDDRIVWKGFILDRKKLFSEIANSEILVFPSLWEALPWPALLEGLGSSRPVIASNLKGMEKVFRDKKDIILIKPKDEDSLYSAIKLLIKNRNLGSKLGKNGKKTAEHYQWNIISKKVHNVYKSVEQ